ncbi:MAG: type II toxin-antitoxin system RelE/ParE family toxin [archaeon]
MKFKILFHPKAANFIKKLDNETSRRLKDKIKELEEFPEERGKHLSHSNFWRLRMGKHRAIYEISKQKKEVIILFVGPRKNVYDDFTRLL